MNSGIEQEFSAFKNDAMCQKLIRQWTHYEKLLFENSPLKVQESGRGKGPGNSAVVFSDSFQWTSWLALVPYGSLVAIHIKLKIILEKDWQAISWNPQCVVMISQYAMQGNNIMYLLNRHELPW